MTLADVAEAVGGTLLGADPAAVVTAPARFDSRLVEPGGLFVAFPGERVDGHDYAATAMTAGAVAVLASRPVDAPTVLVDDVQAAFGRLAGAIVDRAPGLNVVGVTGSVGKTTTKDLLGHVLGGTAPTVAPPGNRNNELGVPETVSLVTAETAFLVCELGARHVGDVAYLGGLVRPQVGVVTNVGLSHLEIFGSIENTARAKAELVEMLPAGGLAVLNADDPRVAAMAGRSAAPVVTFGEGPHADVYAEEVALDEHARPSFRLCTPAGTARVTLGLSGAHQVGNALAAAAAALRFVPDPERIAQRLGEARRVSAGRMHVSPAPDGVTVINDAYNASPASLDAALRAAARLAGGRRLLAVLGQMNEIGPDSAEHHAEVGRTAAEVGARLVVAVGNADAGRIAEGAAAGGVPADHVPDRAAALELLREHLAPGDVVLVKGSNGVGLQELATRLVADGGQK